MELLDDGFGLALADALLDVGGGALDEVLGLLEAEGGDLADGLDDVDLVGSEVLEADGPLGLLFFFGGGGLGCGRRSTTGGRRGGDGHGGGGGDAEVVLESLVQIAQLEDRHLLEDVHHLVDSIYGFLLCHCVLLSFYGCLGCSGGF